MEWSLDGFFKSGGTTRFVDRLASVLGIHASTIKVVSVYEGSLVIDYEIEEDDDEQLLAIAGKATEIFATDQVDLGAPILDASGNGTDIIVDGVVVAEGYPSIVVTETITNQRAAGNFDADIDILEDETAIINQVITQKNIDGSSGEAIYKQPKDKSAAGVIAGSVLVVAAIIGVAIYKKYKLSKKDLEAVQTASKIRAKKNLDTELEEVQVGGYQTNHTSAKLKNETEDILQYDAAGDFNIFTSGQNFQDLPLGIKQKVNQADIDENSSQGGTTTLQTLEKNTDSEKGEENKEDSLNLPPI